jgi:hypothetical protein
LACSADIESSIARCIFIYIPPIIIIFAKKEE